jgi:hypothetical protein
MGECFLSLTRPRMRVFIVFRLVLLFISHYLVVTYSFLVEEEGEGKGEVEGRE